ncbi:MAG: ankyrin repeat domain-containing protein [Sandaracinus sp.]|nr:ankyrin repeat domain-containing protein [Myxococcales bacterium]MCB9601655.1 ankyrin repeat domain-containing protein [Sandaracinus sp.]MCB9631125.1 ankyrin repeat domain-containing protein [Sandaracinus sp.]
MPAPEERSVAPGKLAELLAKITRTKSLDVRLAERDETPLIWAVSEGYHDLAVTLIEAGVDLNAKNADGNTALLRAACEGRAELASVLVRVGAQLDLTNHDGYSALVLAKRRGHRDIVELLLAAGADRSLRAKGGASFESPGDSPKRPLRGPRDAALEHALIDAITQSRDGRMQGRTLDKNVDLDPELRFVSTRVLRDAYVRHDATRSPDAPRYVPLDEGMELGIARAVPEIARAISSLLCRSLEDARHDRGGHLPPEVVARVQREIISPYGVAHLWGITGHRFVLSRAVGPDRSEILGTILVGRSKDTIFFFTGRYNNLRHSTMHETVDFAQRDHEGAEHRWFDRFAFPAIERFKPRAYHHIANFVVAKEHRGRSLSRFLLAKIVESYSRDHLAALGRAPAHSQHLLCGRGLWQIGDPPRLERMERLGFYRRRGAESFFLEHEWAPLPPLRDRVTGEVLSNVDYNRSFGLPETYLAPPSSAVSSVGPGALSDEHLDERVPEVIRLATDPSAKLQYFQAMFDFTETNEER